MSKKGFTLIELLAVIAILAILVVIAVPNILSLFNESRIKSYNVDAQAVYEAAQTQWQLAQFDGATAKTYTNVDGEEGESLSSSATISGTTSYCVIIDITGAVTKFSYYNNGYYYDGTDVSKTSIVVAQNSQVSSASCD